MHSSLVGSRHIFVDESGDPDLPVSSEGHSSYFVICATILPTADLSEQESKARKIIDRYFPGGELKSKKIGGNIRRRKAILNDISRLEFKHYSHVISKVRIRTESGLAFRKSFVKFIHRALYSKLFQAFAHIHIIADEYGTSQFMLDFAKYLERRIQRGLFESIDFSFASSSDYPFIQISDAIAGSIQRCYSGKDDMSILDPLRDRTILIEEWPPRVPEPMGLSNLPRDEQLDFLIRYHAVRAADVFIEANTSSADDIVQAQVIAARYLLYHFRSVNPMDYITTSALQSNLSRLGFSLSERLIRSRVIGGLRNQSVFIASSHKGIKIPYSTEDLRRFVATASSQVVPYLHRLEICRKHFLLATNNELDIVDEESFPDLHRYLRHAS
jgi:hypothetical protein